MITNQPIDWFLRFLLFLLSFSFFSDFWFFFLRWLGIMGWSRRGCEENRDLRGCDSMLEVCAVCTSTVAANNICISFYLSWQSCTNWLISYYFLVLSHDYTNFMVRRWNADEWKMSRRRMTEIRVIISLHRQRELRMYLYDLRSARYNTRFWMLRSGILWDLPFLDADI